MLKKKKAIELSINMVILAVVGLIVLVVIIAIFTNVSSNAQNTFGSGSEESCRTRGGECKEDKFCDDVPMPNICPDESKVCCIPIET